MQTLRERYERGEQLESWELSEIAADNRRRERYQEADMLRSQARSCEVRGDRETARRLRSDADLIEAMSDRS